MKNDISKYISHQMLHKWTRREKYVKYPNFPTPFCLSLTLVRNVLAKFQDPSNLHTPPVDKSNARFQLIKVHKQLASCQEIISPNETKKTNGTTGHPNFNENGSGFRIRISQEQHRIATCFLRRCRIEEKVALFCMQIPIKSSTIE